MMRHKCILRFLCVYFSRAFSIETGWMARVRSLTGTTDFSLLHSVQTSSRAYPTSNPMWVSGALLLEVNSQGMKLITHLHLVPRLRMVELYFHSPICLHGIVLNYE
jgi:hypothetical protein